METRLKSRKLWVLLGNVVLVLLQQWGVDLPADALLPLQALSGSYLIGQGIADHGKRSGRTDHALDN